MKYNIPKIIEAFKWYRWFAWRPITLFTEDGKQVIVWCETIWRYRHYSVYYGYGWEYLIEGNPRLHRKAYQGKSGGITTRKIPTAEVQGD